MDTRFLCLLAIVAGATALTISGSKTVNGQTAQASITIPLVQSRIPFLPGRLPGLGRPPFLPPLSGLVPGLRPPFGGWPRPGPPSPGGRPSQQVPPSGGDAPSSGGDNSSSGGDGSSSGGNSEPGQRPPPFGLPGYPGFQLNPLINWGRRPRLPCRRTTSTTSTTSTPEPASTSTTEGDATSAGTTEDDATSSSTTEDDATSAGTTEESTTGTSTSTTEDDATSASTTEESSTTDSSSSSSSTTEESSTTDSSSSSSSTTEETTTPGGRRRRSDSSREARHIRLPFLDGFFNRTTRPPMSSLFPLPSLNNNGANRPTNLPGLSTFPAIPGLRNSIEQARERVLKAVGGGTDVQSGIHKAVNTALRSEEPQPRLAALIYTIADIYALAAQNCPLLIGASYLAQEAFNVVSSIIGALNNTTISASLNVTTT